MATVKRQPDPPARPADYAAPLELHQAETRPPTGDPGPLFFYTAHPRSWQVRGDKILPDLSKAPVVGGINGVEARLDRAGRLIGWDLSGFKSQMRRAGKTPIPHSVDAPEHESYVRQPYPGYHIDRWSTLYPGSDLATRDEDAFAEWRQSLVDRGIIAPVSYAALRQMEDIRARTIPKLHTQAAGSARVLPSVESEIARLEADLVVIRKYLAAATKPEAGLASTPAHATSLEL